MKGLAIRPPPMCNMSFKAIYNLNNQLMNYNDNLIDYLIELLEDKITAYRTDVNESTMGIIVGLVKAVDVLKKVKENGVR